MRNKKLFAILTLVCFMFTLMPVAAFAGTEDTVILKIDSKNVYKNGEVITTDVAPTIVDGRTMVPVRVIMEALGGEVDWDADNRIVTIHIDGKVLRLVIDKEIADFGTGAIIIDGRTMVPIRYISEYAGYEVEWVESTRQVIITKAEQAVEYTVSFDMNTGSEGVFKTVTVKAGQTVEKPEIEYKSGKVFHGWYTNDEGKGDVFDFSTPIYSDLTLYGHWSAQSYSGGSSSSSTPSHTHSYVLYETNNNGTHKVKCACGDVKPEDEACNTGVCSKCGFKYVVSNSEELKAAIEAGETNIWLNANTYNMPAAAAGKTFTISGTHNAIIEVVPAGQDEANGQLDYSLDGSTVTFNGITIKTNSQLYAGYARLSATYNNCVIQNTYNLGTGDSVFNNCEINITNEYLRVNGAYSATFNGCTFNTDGRAILVFQDGTSVAQTVTVKDCTFNATAPAYTWNKIHVAAVSCDGSRGGTYTVKFEGNNTVDEDFAGLVQIKDQKDDNVTIEGAEISELAYVDVVSTGTELTTALANAVDGSVISLASDIAGDVTVTQKPGVKVTIDGNNKTLAGVITVDGKSGTYTTAGLTIKNVNFKADSISADACIRLGDGTTDTRYTCNVIVENCTFDVPGAVGVKSYTGGDKNLTISGCTATENMHSLVQAKGIDGILVDNCKVYSKNGLNFNNSDNVTVSGCTVDVKGYAVRFGESSGGTGAAETYLIKNCSLTSANDDGDAVIILRGTADNATLTIVNTTITGTPDITNTATGATVVR